DPLPRDPVGTGDPRQMVDRSTLRHRARPVEQRPDRAQRVPQIAIAPAVDQRGAAGRRVQAEQDAQRAGLTGAVPAEETGDPAGPYGEADVVDGRLSAITFAEPRDFDHRVPRRIPQVDRGWTGSACGCGGVVRVPRKETSTGGRAAARPR